MQTSASVSSSPSLLPEGVPLTSLAEVQKLDPREGELPWCWVEGEVSDLSTPPSGHEYFHLNADGAHVPCVLFASISRRHGVPLYNGLIVTAYVLPQASPKDSTLELDVREVRVRSGQGPQQTRLEVLRERLRTEGLLDPARKRPLPTPPTCVGIITSPTSQVLHDIMHVLRQRAPGLATQFIAAATEGEGAPMEIASALRAMSTCGIADVVILARGGGPERYRAAYNTEIVARAIAGCSVPVISAIGHEPDSTLADCVADLRCATPSVAAERVASLAEPVPLPQRRATPHTASGIMLYMGGLRVHIDTVSASPRGFAAE